MKITIQLQGLDCADCAAELEESISKIQGVNSCAVAFMTQKMELDYADEFALETAIDTANHFEEVKVVTLPPTNQKIILQVEGLDCAACAAELEQSLLKVEGIVSCVVVFMTQKIALEYTSKEGLEKAKDIIEHFEEVKIVADVSPKAEPIDESKKGTLIKIQNLHCASCAAALQEDIEKIKGVKSASVNFVGQNIYVEVENEKILKKVIQCANHFEKVKVVNEGELLSSSKETHFKEWLLLGISAGLFLVAILCEHFWLTQVGKIFSYVVYGLSYFTIGYPVLIDTAKNIVKGKIFDENFLMTIASVGAFCLLQLSEAVEVMWLYQLGELLQSIAVGSSRKSITSLMDLKSESATLLKGNEQIVVKPESLAINDIILVKAGEKIPVDGVVVKGNSALDTKSLTGEGLPREVEEGSEVLSGCINTSGNLQVKVIREYSDSAVAKILDLVENSASKKAAPEKFITKFSRYYTPAVCGIAAVIAVIVPLIVCLVSGNFAWATWSSFIQKALGLLVISCPCALIISIPLTYFGGIGSAARYGILVKGATYLDLVAKAKIAAFDKTGTLTKGNFEIVNVVGDKDVLPLAVAAERGSSHPLAKPFEKYKTAYVAENVQEVAGHGIKAIIHKRETLVGNSKLLMDNHVEFTPVDSLSTIVYVAQSGKYLGYIEIDDKEKENVNDSLAQIKKAGVEECVMITGDNLKRAEYVSGKISNIDKVYADLLPDEKLKVVEQLKQKNKVLYVGDGINDAPVMNVADCSFSMGQIGSGAAIEASDFVLISDNLQAVADTILIAKKTKRIVLENLIFSLVAKLSLMVLAIVITLPLSIAVFGDVGVMLLAVLNSMRMRLKIRK